MSLIIYLTNEIKASAKEEAVVRKRPRSPVVHPPYDRACIAGALRSISLVSIFSVFSQFTERSISQNLIPPRLI